LRPPPLYFAVATPRKATEHGKGEDWIVPACYIKNKAKSISLLLCVLRQQNIGEVAADRRGWSYKKLLFYLSHPLSVENYCFFCFSPLSLCDTRGRSVKSILTSQKRMF